MSAATSTVSSAPNPQFEAQSTDHGKTKGTCFYKVNVYHTKLMKWAQHLSEIASVSLWMEINGVMSDENLHFAELLLKCGDELIDIGEHLKTHSAKIKAACNEFIEKQIKEQQEQAKTKTSHSY